MGQSSSQLQSQPQTQATQPPQQSRRNGTETPSTTASQMLERTLQQSALKSSRHVEAPPRKRRRAQVERPDVYNFPSDEDVPVRPDVASALPRKLVPVVSLSPQLHESDIGNGNSRDTGPFSQNEIRTLEHVFDRYCVNSDLTRLELQTNIEKWGEMGTDWDFKREVYQALPRRGVHSLRKCCRRVFRPDVKLSSATSVGRGINGLTTGLETTSRWVTGPFSRAEQAKVQDTFEMILAHHQIPPDEMRDRIQTWRGDNNAAFRDSLAIALPQRKPRSLMDFSRRKYCEGSVGKAAGAEKDPLSADEADQRFEDDVARIEVSESSFEEPQALETGMPSISGTRIPRAAQENDSPKSASKESVASESAIAEGTNGNVKLSAESHPKEALKQSRKRKRGTEESQQASLDAPAFTPEALKNVNVFELGDYYEILKETMMCLADKANEERRVRIWHLWKHEGVTTSGNLEFWRAVTDLLPDSRFNKVKDREVVAEMRRLAFVLMSRRYFPRATLEVILQDEVKVLEYRISQVLQQMWAVESKDTEKGKKFCRNWAHDLAAANCKVAAAEARYRMLLQRDYRRRGQPKRAYELCCTLGELPLPAPAPNASLATKQAWRKLLLSRSCSHQYDEEKAEIEHVYQGIGKHEQARRDLEERQDLFESVRRRSDKKMAGWPFQETSLGEPPEGSFYRVIWDQWRDDILAEQPGCDPVIRSRYETARPYTTESPATSPSSTSEGATSGSAADEADIMDATATRIIPDSQPRRDGEESEMQRQQQRNSESQAKSSGSSSENRPSKKKESNVWQAKKHTDLASVIADKEVGVRGLSEADVAGWTDRVFKANFANQRMKRGIDTERRDKETRNENQDSGQAENDEVESANARSEDADDNEAQESENEDDQSESVSSQEIPETQQKLTATRLPLTAQNTQTHVEQTRHLVPDESDKERTSSDETDRPGDEIGSESDDDSEGNMAEDDSGKTDDEYEGETEDESSHVPLPTASNINDTPSLSRSAFVRRCQKEGKR